MAAICFRADVGIDMNDAAPLTEPELIPCLYVSGMGIEISDMVVRMVGWVHLPVLGGETEERRIVTRIAMSNAEARNLMATLRKALARGGH